MSIRDEIGVGLKEAQDMGFNPEPKFDDIPHTHFSNIPADLMIIKFIIGEKQFAENLRNILYFGRSDLESMDYREIDKTLDGMSEWQFTLTSALGHVQYYIALTSAEIEDEKAKGYRVSEQCVIDRKKEELGRVTAEIMRVSNDEKHHEFLRDQELSKEYRILIDRIHDLYRQETILKGALKILEQRTTSMQGIARRHFKQETGYTD